MNALGRHVLVEFFECSSEILNDVTRIENIMVTAAHEAGATVINSTFHHFSPYGVTGVVVIQESHLAMHTWPEYRYAAVDLFTCGDPVDPWVSYEYLLKELRAEHGSTMEIHRGQLSLLKQHRAARTRSAPILYDASLQPVTQRNLWFTERDENIALSLRYKDNPLFRKKSAFQRVEVFDTYAYGKILTCDGIIMCAEYDEHIYHEMIAHVPGLTHPDASQVLVIGGGDGGTIRELLKHDNIKKIIQVEIDEIVIEASKKHLPNMSVGYGDPRVELIIADGVDYVKKNVESRFDIVIVDSTDPVGPAQDLFTEEFCRNVYDILNDDGLMITQSESPLYKAHIFKQIYQIYQNIFGSKQVFCYLAYIPTYPTGMWSFSYCCKGKLHPLDNLDDVQAQFFTNRYDLHYYSPAVHRAAFALPRFVQKTILDSMAIDKSEPE